MSAIVKSPTVKPGYKTSEFWLSTVTSLLSLLYASGLIVDGSTAGKIAAFAVAALSTVGYQVVRGKVKS